MNAHCTTDQRPAVRAAEVRAYLDDMVVREPELFERMALREIRKLRPRLPDQEALSVAYDAVLAVAALAERIPVRLDTVLGLVRTYLRWSARDRIREFDERKEVPVGIGRTDCGDELAGLVSRTPGTSLSEDVRVAAHLRMLDELAARLRARIACAVRDGTLHLSLAQVDALHQAVHADPDRPLGADAATRKRLERARTAIARWVRHEVGDDAERQLLALVLGHHLPRSQQRGRESELVRVLGLDRSVLGIVEPQDRRAA